MARWLRDQSPLLLPLLLPFPWSASGFAPTKFHPTISSSAVSAASSPAAPFPPSNVGTEVADCLARLERDLLKSSLFQGRNAAPTSPFVAVQRESGDFAIDSFVDADCKGFDRGNGKERNGDGNGYEDDGKKDTNDEDGSLWIVDLIKANKKFRELYDYVGATSSGKVELKYCKDGVRGVYVVDRTIAKGDILTSIPLSACLRDDVVPDWMVKEEDDDSNGPYYLEDAWATRLAAGVIDLQLKDPSSLWLSMLPDPLLLSASLPIHWPEDVLASTKCTALELAVDSAYFARASTIQDLIEGLQNCAPKLESSTMQSMCERALDIVQTRSCRIMVGETARRVIAPIFDLINHGNANSEFGLEDGNFLVVRATRDINPNEEVRIDYGASTRPAWKCLMSYGFVPESKEVDEDDVAEVYLDGVRYEVGPSMVPVELVEAAMNMDGNISVDKDIVLTPEISRLLAQRLSNVAYQLLLEPEPVLWEDDEKDGANVDPSLVIAHQLAASMRWSQHRVLASCAFGLRDWANEEDSHGDNQQQPQLEQ